MLATVLYDATSSDYEPRHCAIAVPGAVAVFDPEDSAPTIVRGARALWRSMLSAH